MKTIVITGSSDGIGKALVHQLYKEYKIIALGRNVEKMKKLKEECPLIIDYTFDLINQQELYQCIQTIKEQHKVDILINNAGANVKKEMVIHQNIDEFNYMMQLNCISPLILMQEFAKEMIQNKKGHIINVLSTCCLFDNVTMSGYTASKKAFEAFSKALTKEIKEYNVFVTNIYPGGTNTNFRAIERLDYLNPTTVAKAIQNVLAMPNDGCIQDLVLRPLVENNY